MLVPAVAITIHSIALMAASALWTPAGDATPGVHTAVAAEASAPQTRRLKLVLAPTGNEARYRVREQLVGVDFPNDAIGKTSKIEGSLMLELPSGRIVKDSSKFTVDLASLVSDQSRRDNFIRTRTLQTAENPTAVFIPASATGLPASLPVAGDVAFKLTGDFTVHGVTRSTTWDVKGKMLSTGEFTGTATTAFKFGDFNMTVPRVVVVMSVEDEIKLEMDLHLLPH